MKAVFCCTLLMVSHCGAAEWGIYAGVAGTIDFPITTEFHHNLNSYPYATNDANYGTQFEAGIRLGSHEFYGAFHQNDSPEWSDVAHATAEVPDVVDVTTKIRNVYGRSENQYSLGYRFRPKQRKQSFAPFIGGGLCVGKVWQRSVRDGETRTVSYEGGGSDVELETWHINSSKATTFAGGIVAEFGTSIYLDEEIEVLPALRLHTHLERYQSNWNGDFWIPDRNIVFTPSIQLQVRYTFTMNEPKVESPTSRRKGPKRR